MPAAPGAARGARRIALWLSAALLAWTFASLAITGWDWQDRWTTAGREALHFLRLWLYWLSAALPLALAAVLALALSCSTSRARLLCLLVALGLGAGSWARLVEPELLRVREAVLHGAPAPAEPVRIALVADLHQGLFGREYQLRRLVRRLNELGVDAVFFAGDWTNEPRRDLVAGLAPLRDLQMPAFAVLGNHDTGAPGPPLAGALRQALQANDVQLIEGRRVRWRGWELAGLADLWGGSPRGQVRTLPGSIPNRLLLAHQPDTYAFVPPGSAFLGMAGHTHGGQIRLPWLTGLVLRSLTHTPWWDGLYDTPAGRVFVTPGVGTIGLPMRFGVPPTIDVISLVR